jgi:type IV pilus assembly protein PilE
MKHSQSGFTLIELMITVAIVAILAGIAYPSYRDQVRRSNRAEGRSALLQVQVAQEKFFLQNNRYAGAATAAGSVTELNNAPTIASPGVPGLGIPSVTPRGHYTITLVRPNNTEYEARATATGSQQSDTACAVLTINHRGVRTPSTDNCWK